MRPLSAAQLLQVWEQGMREHPVDRALTLLVACCDESRQALAGFSIGRRDALLLQVYERLFGPDMEAYAQCPQCGERLEYRLSTREISAPVRDSEMPLVLEIEGKVLHLRLPNSTDLRAASDARSFEDARRSLLQRCVLESDGSEAQPETWTDAMIEKISSSLAQADPQAETLIDLVCCACRHGWQVLLDIEGFLWMKIS